MKCTVIRTDTGKPFIDDADIVTNSDGSISFRLPNSKWAGQEPNAYGVRHPDQAGAESPGVYQRATRTGNVVTFLTRPQDIVCAYMLFEGKVY